MGLDTVEYSFPVLFQGFFFFFKFLNLLGKKKSKLPEVRLVGNIVLRTMVSLWLDWYGLPASKKYKGWRCGGS